ATSWSGLRASRRSWSPDAPIQSAQRLLRMLRTERLGETLMRDKFIVSPAAGRHHSAEDIQSGNIGDKYDITFFVSCYNEEEFIVATLDTVQSAMEGLGLTYDIVIIDDGSKDRS